MLANLINGANIRMVQCRGRAGFLLEALQRPGILAVLPRQELQCYVSLQLQVFGPENDTHSASAQFVKHQIVGDGLALQIVKVDFRAGGSKRFGSRGCGGGRLDPFHFSQKAVTAARHRLDVTRLFGRFSQRVAQPSNGVVDRRVEFDHGLVRPELIANVRPQYHFAGMIQQEEQNPHWLFAQLEPDTVLAQLSRTHVELERSEAI